MIQSIEETSDYLRGKLSVWVVEDHEQIRNTVIDVITQESDMKHAVGLDSMEQVIKLAQNPKTTLPSVILLDLGLPGLSGLSGIPLIKEMIPGCRILIFTISKDEQRTQQALSSGVDGYILKDENPEQIPHFIRQVARGESPVSASIARSIFNFFQKGRKSKPKASQKNYSLSETHLQILTLMSNGMVKAEVSEALGMSYHQIDYHMRMIYKNLQVNTVHGAVGKAMRENLIGNTTLEK